jgi:hypothetical protein
VGDPRTRSGDRFTLKAIAKEGTSIRREKKRSIKESMVLNPDMLNQIFYQKYLLITLGKKNHKVITSLGNKRQRLSKVNETSTGAGPEKDLLLTLE